MRYVGIIIAILIVAFALFFFLRMANQNDDVSNNGTGTDDATLVSPTPTVSSSPTALSEEQVSQIRSRLQEEGFRLEETVARVLPGVGFTVATDTNREILVYDPDTTVTAGQQVRISGTALDNDDALTQLRGQTGVTSEVETLIQESPLVIQAREVTSVT